MVDRIAPGEVWLVGAGPGDPDLLTRKAERLIAAADIVFYDALVGPGILDLIADGVERISVGKRSGRHSKDQASINDLLLAAALAGKRVIRLKGGDPGIFGRAGEEMDHLAAHGIAVRICPGITAASAAAASAGVSLTRRGAAQSLTLLTAHARAGATLDIDWARLADPATTIAIYMGKAAARMVSAELIAAGLPGATPAIVVENASLPGERIVRTRLDLLEIATAATLSGGPALLLIGAGLGPRSAGSVCNRSEQGTGPQPRCVRRCGHAALVDLTGCRCPLAAGQLGNPRTDRRAHARHEHGAGRAKHDAAS